MRCSRFIPLDVAQKISTGYLAFLFSIIIPLNMLLYIHTYIPTYVCIIHTVIVHHPVYERLGALTTFGSGFWPTKPCDGIWWGKLGFAKHDCAFKIGNYSTSLNPLPVTRRPCSIIWNARKIGKKIVHLNVCMRVCGMRKWLVSLCVSVFVSSFFLHCAIVYYNICMLYRSERWPPRILCHCLYRT